MALIDPTEGRLTPILDDLEAEIEQALNNPDTNPVTTYLDMLTTPVVGAAVELKILLGLSMMGEFTHDDERMRDFIRSDLSNMDGSFQTAIAELLVAIPLGYSASEFTAESRDGEWHLKSLHILDPRNYEFRGQGGGITKAVYNSSTKGEIDVDYAKLIHIVHGAYLSFGDPHGRAECRRALAPYLATRIVQNLMLASIKTQATPAVAGYAPAGTNVNLLGPNGRPLVDSEGNQVKVSAINALQQDLRKLGTNGVITTDLNNKIEVLSQQTDGVFFMQALAYLERLQWMAYLVPETALTVQGSGDSNLASNQTGLLRASVGATMNQVKERLIKCLVKPLIRWNFGEQEDYGSFPEPEHDSTDQAALLGVVSRAAEGGSLGPVDLDVVNRNRELAGIPALEELVAPVGTEAAFSVNYTGRLDV